jgi:hypothetical protein
VTLPTGATSAFEIARVQVWVGELEDRPGALASKLAHLMTAGGANLEFIIARPLKDQPGRGLLYVAPLLKPEATRIARDIGLHPSETIHALRLAGPDRPGLVAGIAGTLAESGINITGLTAAATQGRAIAYLRFSSPADADAAATVLTPALAGQP